MLSIFRKRNVQRNNAESELGIFESALDAISSLRMWVGQLDTKITKIEMQISLLEASQNRIKAKHRKGKKMPWTGKTFAEKHNHKLKGKAAENAAAQATAMVNAGVPEGEAIATANKNAKKKSKPHEKMYGKE